MKAILLKEYGLPNALEIGEAAKPVPKDDEVLVRIHSAAINDWDWGVGEGQTVYNSSVFRPEKAKSKYSRG